MADLNQVNADGYFKEDLKVEVGSFSLDMLDLDDDSDDNKVLEKDEEKENDKSEKNEKK
jgi:hypothetical protein